MKFVWILEDEVESWIGSLGKVLVMGFSQITKFSILIFMVFTNNVKTIKAKEIIVAWTNLVWDHIS